MNKFIAGFNDNGWVVSDGKTHLNVVLDEESAKEICASLNRMIERKKQTRFHVIFREHKRYQILDTKNEAEIIAEFSSDDFAGEICCVLNNKQPT